MATLLAMDLDADDADEGYVTATWALGDAVTLLVKQKPAEGREYRADKEAAQEYAMQHPEESFGERPGGGEHGAFPNVGLVVWQSGFVLAELLLRCGGGAGGGGGAKAGGGARHSCWRGRTVLDLGAGTGQLGIALALGGGCRVLLTDLPHIVPLTRQNIALNAARCQGAEPRAEAYRWGEPAAGLEPPPPSTAAAAAAAAAAGDGAGAAATAGGGGGGGGGAAAGAAAAGVSGRRWDAIVAADVLYEPQLYDRLLDSLCELAPPPLSTSQQQQQPGGSGAPPAPYPAELDDDDDEQQQQQQPQQQHQQQQLIDLGGAGGPPPVFVAYRVRRYGEGGFEAKARRRGFRVAAVPLERLHEEYRCGGYRVVRLDRVAASGGDGGGGGGGGGGGDGGGGGG